MNQCSKCGGNTKKKRYCNKCLGYFGAASRYKTTFDHIKYLRENTFECQICTLPFKTSRSKHIDHCHYTGEIRGVVCVNCNIALGNAKDNVQILKNMIKYLTK